MDNALVIVEEDEVMDAEEVHEGEEGEDGGEESEDESDDDVMYLGGIDVEVSNKSSN